VVAWALSWGLAIFGPAVIYGNLLKDSRASWPARRRRDPVAFIDDTPSHVRILRPGPSVQE
jgi:hypothetical protein